VRFNARPIAHSDEITLDPEVFILSISAPTFLSGTRHRPFK
jgi:hypothetical protein